MLKKVKMFCMVIALVIFKAGIGFGLPIAEIEYNITESSGIWTYNYTLKNTGSEDIWLWDIYPTVTVSDITKPSIAWDFFTDNKWIEWYSLSTEISPGGSLSGFSYKSSGSPGWIKYEVTSIFGGISPPGYTLGATPEPYSFLLLGSGLLVGIRLLRTKSSKGKY